MKYMTVITITAASLLAIAPLSADIGQGKGSGSAKQAQQPGQAQHSDMHHQRTQAKERVHYEQHHMYGDSDIYGGDLMSEAERDRYRERPRMHTSDAERAQ